MKRNVLLRASAYLLLAVIASMSLLTGTWAKYIASATVSASARVARFSFLVGSMKPDANGGYTGTAKTKGGSPSTYWGGNNPADYWEQVVKVAGTGNLFVQTISVPMFAKEYDHRDPARTATVRSSNSDALVAPGIGHHVDWPAGNAQGNPNYSSSVAPGKNSYVTALEGAYLDGGGTDLVFRNDSEVAVRYKVEYDRRSLPIYNFEQPTGTPALGCIRPTMAKMKADFPAGVNGVNDWYCWYLQGASVPLLMRAQDGGGTVGDPYSWFRADYHASTALWGDGAYAGTEPYPWWDNGGLDRFVPVTRDGNSPWRTLAPGAEEVRQICWIWRFDPAAGWNATYKVQERWPGDYFDTWLGLAAAEYRRTGKATYSDGSTARMWQWNPLTDDTGDDAHDLDDTIGWPQVNFNPEINLYFRVTVEQAD